MKLAELDDSNTITLLGTGDGESQVSSDLSCLACLSGLLTGSRGWLQTQVARAEWRCWLGSRCRH
ncbi:hypothetical protein CROQUDRAFT_666604 [Cronartium quercuum f. sp. fusiforme G11]|uniref:Uncharacterized protein n=1 Tax=Cronartium quercuum f. sp. fusiforme G11 TaxID=708437 RepID=A0A9P6N579_9BASI|nr:hypothetical protein CROQUDRAFT_666604 [Cronartium quercuum f. sp. fusiforme G11]